MIRALLRDGREVDVDPALGATVDALVDRLTQSSLTGSAAALAGARIRSVEGEEIAYMDVQTFAEIGDFVGGEAR